MTTTFPVAVSRRYRYRLPDGAINAISACDDRHDDILHVDMPSLDWCHLPGFKSVDFTLDFKPGRDDGRADFALDADFSIDAPMILPEVFGFDVRLQAQDCQRLLRFIPGLIGKEDDRDWPDGFNAVVPMGAKGAWSSFVYSDPDFIVLLETDNGDDLVICFEREGQPAAVSIRHDRQALDALRQFKEGDRPFPERDLAAVRAAAISYLDLSDRHLPIVESRREAFEGFVVVHEAHGTMVAVNGGEELRLLHSDGRVKASFFGRDRHRIVEMIRHSNDGDLPAKETLGTWINLLSQFPATYGGLRVDENGGRHPL